MSEKCSKNTKYSGVYIINSKGRAKYIILVIVLVVIAILSAYACMPNKHNIVHKETPQLKVNPDSKVVKAVEKTEEKVKTIASESKEKVKAIAFESKVKSDAESATDIGTAISEAIKAGDIVVKVQKKKFITVPKKKASGVQKYNLVEVKKGVFVEVQEQKVIEVQEEEAIEIKVQELNEENEIGKILLDKKYLKELPKCKIGEIYKFFVSVSVKQEITVKAGATIDTAVQLYPKPDKYDVPYDILN